MPYIRRITLKPFSVAAIKLVFTHRVTTGQITFSLIGLLQVKLRFHSSGYYRSNKNTPSANCYKKCENKINMT